MTRRNSVEKCCGDAQPTSYAISVSGESLRLNCVWLAPEVFAPIEKMGEALRCGDGIVVSFRLP